MLKISGFGDEIAQDFETQLREMRKINLNYIALRNLWGVNILDLDAKQKKRAKELLKRYGMGVSEIGSPLGKALITDPWKKEWERYERAIEMAFFFQCPRIRIFSFYFPEGEPAERYRGAIIERFKEMAKRAESEGLLLLHENDAKIYGDTGLRCKDLVEAVDSPHFKLIFDPANYVTEQSRPFTQWFEMQAEHIVHLHIKDRKFTGEFTPAGAGDGEIPQLIRALAQRGFSGFATMEPHLMQGGQFAGFSGPERFSEAVEAFRAICDQAGMPHRQVRMGVVGMGFIGLFHCESIREVPQAHLVATADVAKVPNLKKAEERFNVMAYDNPKDMLQRPDIDAITIGTPSGLHGEITLLAAENKKHVLTEKPIEVTLEKADAMIKACRNHRVKLGVISQRRWDAGMREFKQAMDSGALGKPLIGDAQIKWFRTQQYYDSGGWRGTWKLDGGGCLMNQSIHTVDCLQWLMGEAESITAQTALLAHKNIEVEDIAQALVRWKNGAVGTLVASTAVYPGLEERIEISGTNGTMILEKNRIILREVMGEKKREAGETGDRGSGAADPQAITHEGHVQQIADFIRAILEDREPFITGEEGRKPLEIILAVYESARTGKTVKLPLKKRKKA